MLIKQADCQAAHFSELESRAKQGGSEAKRAEKELSIRRAGVRAEQQAAYLIDFEFATAPNWAVIHDLRVEHGGRVAQIDHMLINRWMDVYVLETKSVFAGVKITEEGEFLRWNDYKKRYEGMASPIEQNERHVQVLRDVMKSIELPTRLGLRILPTFQSLVLISPTATINRPKTFDASRVIKADQLKKSIWRDIDDENPLLGVIKTAAKIVSRETVEAVARQVAGLHRPLSKSAPPANAAAPDAVTPPTASSTSYVSGRKRIEPVLAKEASAPTPRRAAREAVAPPAAAPGCVCKACQSSSGSVLSGKYGYYFKCQTCGTNTAIRFTCQPGHAPRLRGERGSFFRDCPQCATSVLFHRNSSAEATP